MKPGRSNGLDTLRAIAITLVFAYHYGVFVSRESTFGTFGDVGWIGVDLFFVLSGYLIGHQVLGGIAGGRRLSLPAFYWRRALRTWPAFWVVLAIYFLWPTTFGGNAPPPLWRFLTFTQNVGLQPGTAFSHAWSLCIEEQFYLVLPLTVLLALRLGTHVRQAWVWLMARGRALFAAGVVVTACVVYAVDTRFYVDGYGYTFAMTAFGYSATALAFAILVASALSPSSPLSRVRIPSAYTIALWSYSIYLSHKAVAFVLHQQATRFAWSSAIEVAVIAAASVGVGAALHRMV